MPETELHVEHVEEPLESLIFVIRGQRVMLDADLARIYGVSTKVFNQAVKRNGGRFPSDFAYQLTGEEYANLRSRIADSATQPFVAPGVVMNRSQFVTGSQKHRDSRTLPWAFTEHGAIMAANVLRSGRAVQMSVYVIRAFVRMREQIAANAAILKRLAEIDKTLLEHDEVLRALWRQLQPLLQPPADPPHQRMGFMPRGGK